MQQGGRATAWGGAVCRKFLFGLINKADFGFKTLLLCLSHGIRRVQVLIVRIYFLDGLDRIRRGEWLECEMADVPRLACDRLGDYCAVEVWRSSEKLLRIERQSALQSNASAAI